METVIGADSALRGSRRRATEASAPEFPAAPVGAALNAPWAGGSAQSGEEVVLGHGRTGGVLDA
jgi:hypothetical protein